VKVRSKTNKVHLEEEYCREESPFYASPGIVKNRLGYPVSLTLCGRYIRVEERGAVLLKVTVDCEQCIAYNKLYGKK
jgi:hypothetical protein